MFISAGKLESLILLKSSHTVWYNVFDSQTI